MYSWEDPRFMSKEERMASRKEFYRPRTMEELVAEAEERELREEDYFDDGYADNMPCDNSGYCAGTGCSNFFKCKGKET